MPASTQHHAAALLHMALISLTVAECCNTLPVKITRCWLPCYSHERKECASMLLSQSKLLPRASAIQNSYLAAAHFKPYTSIQTCMRSQAVAIAYLMVLARLNSSLQNAVKSRVRQKVKAQKAGAPQHTGDRGMSRSALFPTCFATWSVVCAVRSAHNASFMRCFLHTAELCMHLPLPSTTCKPMLMLKRMLSWHAVCFGRSLPACMKVPDSFCLL